MANTCESTYWFLDDASQEYVEMHCEYSDRHSHHSGKVGIHSASWSNRVSIGSRVHMESEESKSTAQERRYAKALEDLEFCTKLLKEAEDSLAYRKASVADAKARISANQPKT